MIFFFLPEKNMCTYLPYLKFSDPLPETHVLYMFVKYIDKRNIPNTAFPPELYILSSPIRTHDYRDHTCFFMHEYLPGPEEDV